MKKFKKFLAAGVTAAMLLGAVGVMPEITAEAAASKPQVGYDASKHQLVVSGSSTAAANPAGLVYVATVKNGKIGTYDAFESKATNTTNATKINLAVATTKDVTYSVYTAVDTDPVEITLKGFSTKIKPKVVSAGATQLINMVEIVSGSAAMKADATPTASQLAEMAGVKVRVGTGDWVGISTITGDTLDALLAYGATVYIKIEGTGNQMSSTEVKVKLPKRANAPKATVDYVKGTVKLPKNAEFAEGATSTAYASTGTNGITYYINGTVGAGKDTKQWGGKLIKLRTAANGAKPSSKIGAVSLGAVQTAIANTAGTPAGSVASGISVSVVTSAATATVKNGYSKNIEYVVVDSSFISAGAVSTTADLSTLKWKPLKTNVSVTLKDVKSQYILFRVAGDKTKGMEMFPSDILPSGQIAW